MSTVVPLAKIMPFHGETKALVDLAPATLIVLLVLGSSGDRPGLMSQLSLTVYKLSPTARVSASSSLTSSTRIILM